MIGRIALAFALALPAAASAQGGSGTSASPSDPNRVICRRQTEPGSRTASRRTCMTRAEWERAAVIARDASHDDLRRRNGLHDYRSGCGIPGGC
jgi:hypothetical protein